MIDLNNINNINWEEQSIAILGAGISGLGATKLALHLKANVLLSDIKENKISIAKTNKFKYECFGHSDAVLKSDLIIKSPGIPNRIDIIKRSKKKKIPIVSEIEFASWFSKSDIIALTGSNGKTTTVQLIFEIFKRSQKDVLLGGNVGISYSENVLYERQTKKSFIHILEISSYQAEYLYHFNPKISCLLNISEDHMDRYSNMNEYITAKLNITKNLSKKTILLYNGDDKFLSKRIQPNSDNIIPFSINEDNMIKYHGSSLQLKNKRNEFDNPLIGIHNFYNILAATKIADLYKIKWKSIVQAIISFKPLPHRIEFLLSHKGVKYINDSKSTTLASTIAAIECFDNIILILGGELKGNINIKEFSNCINHKNIKNVIVYGDVSQLLKDQSHIYKNIDYFYEFNKAIDKAIQLSDDGSHVLLSPGFASFDQFKDYKERGNTFKKIINQLGLLYVK